MRTQWCGRLRMRVAVCVAESGLLDGRGSAQFVLSGLKLRAAQEWHQRVGDLISVRAALRESASDGGGIATPARRLIAACRSSSCSTVTQFSTSFSCSGSGLSPFLKTIGGHSLARTAMSPTPVRTPLPATHRRRHLCGLLPFAAGKLHGLRSVRVLSGG